MLQILMSVYIVLFVLIVGLRSYFFKILNKQINRTKITQREHKRILAYLLANIFWGALGMITTASAMFSTIMMGISSLKELTPGSLIPSIVNLGLILSLLILWYKFVVKPLFSKLEEVKQINKTSN